MFSSNGNQALTTKQNSKHMRAFLILFVGLSFSVQAQITEGELFDTFLRYDSMLFDRGYNHCDTATLSLIVSEDLEFYHDQGGIMKTDAPFLMGMASLCDLPYKARRELEQGSLELFPLYDNGQLYGVIQRGIHHFYALEEGKPEYLTSSARFTALWLSKGGDQWMLSRVLSFDHQVPEDEH